MSNLTNNELDTIVKAAEEARQDTVTETTDIDTTDVEASIDAPINGDASDLMTAVVDTMPSMDIDIFNAEDEDAINKELDSKAIENAKVTFELSDDETYQLLTVIGEMRKNDKYPVYKNLPEAIKSIVRQLMTDQNIPISETNTVARLIMNEFINDAGIEQAFIDLQKSIDDALNIPSISDIYTEHTRTVMEKNIPEMIEQIKDEAPEKAELLAKIKDSFTKSYTFTFAIESYTNNARIRKAMRRYETELVKSLNEFNFRNEKSNFKMNDVTEIPKVLVNILIDEPEFIRSNSGTDISDSVNQIINMNITEVDIAKFCILICKSCENLDPTNVVDAAYMYYMMKNIIVLKLTQEAKTDFAAELINNICETITFIRNKEAEFNAANNDKSKHSKKSNSKINN